MGNAHHAGTGSSHHAGSGGSSHCAGSGGSHRAGMGVHTMQAEGFTLCKQEKVHTMRAVGVHTMWAVGGHTMWAVGVHTMQTGGSSHHAGRKLALDCPDILSILGTCALPCLSQAALRQTWWQGLTGHSVSKRPGKNGGSASDNPQDSVLRHHRRERSQAARSSLQMTAQPRHHDTS